MYTRTQVLAEATAQGVSVPWLKVAQFVGCVLVRVARGTPLPVAVARCAASMLQ
jgi:hypothetical protein